MKSSITFSGLVVNNTTHAPIFTCNHLIKKEWLRRIEVVSNSGKKVYFVTVVAADLL